MESDLTLNLVQHLSAILAEKIMVNVSVWSAFEARVRRRNCYKIYRFNLSNHCINFKAQDLEWIIAKQCN